MELEKEDAEIRLGEFFSRHAVFFRHLNVITWSLWGVLARRGLIKLTTFDGSYLPGLVWVNFLACFLMGAFSNSEKVWKDVMKYTSVGSKKEISYFVGLTTGFCGTFSSYSSFILEAFYKSSNQELGYTYTYPTKGYGVLQFLMVIMAHMGLSIMGMISGKNFIQAIDNYMTVLSMKKYAFLELFTFVFTGCSYITVLFLLGFENAGAWRSWMFSCILSPFGSHIRYQFSLYLNPNRPKIPLGTYMANITGTCILAITIILMRGKLPHSSTSRVVTHVNGCHVLDGVSDGFCGSLTTVSSFVAELVNQSTYDAYIYGSFTISTTFIFMILTLGVYSWKVGLTSPACSI